MSAHIDAVAPATIPTGRTASGASSRRLAAWQRRLPLLPALVLVLALTQLPFVMTIYYSLLRWNLLGSHGPRFIDVRNYVYAFTDTTLGRALFNTLMMTGSIVLLSLLFGTLLAIGLNRSFPGRAVVRTLAVMPFFLMPVASALFFKSAFFDPSFGLLGWITASLGLGRVNWLSQHGMFCIVLISAWQWTSFVLMIVLAGLQSFPDDLEEAALVDGAKPRQVFFGLVLPHLKPFLELSGLLVAMYVLENFAAISQLTAGGPAFATTNLSYYVYLQAFSAFDIGHASAYAAIALLVAIALVTLLLRLVSGIMREAGR